MTSLAVHLERLGLEQYLHAFIGEGFDTWETLLDVQESDLEALNVKLGHRRKLQRAIADYRGISYERLIGSPAHDAATEPARPVDGLQSTGVSKENVTAPQAETKRRYRRHPKPDENAPEKPPSAYVLFSNQIREEVKGENLSFTEIAKLVGDRWQKLDPPQKEPFESHATSLKERYNIELSAYRKTDAYKTYASYLTDFKAKHGPQTEAKRPKLDAHSSGGSVSGTSGEVQDNLPAGSGHTRVGSIGSVSAASFSGALPTHAVAAAAAVPSTVTSLPNLVGTRVRTHPNVHRAGSPSTQTNRTLISQFSSHSSTSDDSSQVPHDPLSRTANLSINTPPSTGTPPLLPHTLGSVRSEQVGSTEGYPWPSRTSQSGQPQTGSTTPSGQSSLTSGITLPSPTFSAEPWRDRAPEWARPGQVSLTASAPGQAPSLPLPPLIGPDWTHGPGPRLLPPLRPDTHGGPAQSGFHNTSPVAQISLHGAGDAGRRYSQSQEGAGRQLDRTENEAATTLARLGARLGQDEFSAQARDRAR